MANLNDPALLKQAEEQKMRRFVPRGFIVLIVGVVLIVIGKLLNTGVNSLEGVLIGIGILVIIIGIIMILIGLIKPVSPDQLNAIPPIEVIPEANVEDSVHAAGSSMRVTEGSLGKAGAEEEGGETGEAE